MNDTYTIAALLSPEQAPEYPLIRELAEQVLDPEPRKHEYAHRVGRWYICRKCGHSVASPEDASTPCSVSSVSFDPMPVMAEQLLRKIPSRERYKIFEAIPKVHEFGYTPGFSSIDENEYRYAMWFFWATPAERAVCCLLALLPEKVKVQQ